MEQWKDIEGYEWLYQVSNQGNVKSFKRNNEWFILNPSKDKDWYLHIFLYGNLKKNFSIHRLVALSFIPNLENKPQVNHIDWDKNNNNILNLEWATSKENINHSWSYWLSKISSNHHFYTNHPSKWRFWNNHFNSRVIFQYSKQLEFIKEWWSIIDASRELWISKRNISWCCKWECKTSGWFIWRYK